MTRELKVVYRDLAAEPLGHMSGEHFVAAQGAGVELPTELQHDVALGQAALAEFLASDIVVIGAPMYNFTIPSQLKSWVDRITVAGQTFRYGPEGVKGLAGGKKVVIVSTRGGRCHPPFRSPGRCSRLNDLEVLALDAT
jgi:FMN-dependent NADH-azoreductase